jgi:hypothetical protein
MHDLFMYAVSDSRGEIRVRNIKSNRESHMRNRKKHNARVLFLFVFALAGISISIGLTGCGSPKPAQPEPGPSRYSLSGRVVSVDKAKQQVTVDAADIPGFMMAMSMGYDVKNPALLESVSPEDQITADVMVNGNDVWLENIVVVKKPDNAKAPPSNDAHPTSPAPAKH